jgi:hypothetical protein
MFKAFVFLVIYLFGAKGSRDCDFTSLEETALRKKSAEIEPYIRKYPCMYYNNNPNLSSSNDVFSFYGRGVFCSGKESNQSATGLSDFEILLHEEIVALLFDAKSQSDIWQVWRVLKRLSQKERDSSSKKYWEMFGNYSQK